MPNISNQLIKDSYNYVLQSDLSTGIVYRIDGVIPTNPTFLSGLTIENSFKFTNGSEQLGYVLTSDNVGNATWSPMSGSSLGDYLPLSGGTVSGTTNFTNGLTANTFSATTYQNLPLDIFVTGGTKTGDTAIFTNNTGGTFNLTGLTDTFLTGGTYDSNTELLTLTNNDGSDVIITGITTSSSLTVTDTITTVSAVSGITFTGSTVINDGGGNITVITGTIRRNFTNGNINYCGFAPIGSLESDPVWTITKITVAFNGSFTTQVFNNVTWTSVPF